MEFVIKYMLMMIGIIAVILLYSMARNEEVKGFNFKKIPNKRYSPKNGNKKPLFKIIGFIGVAFLAILILPKLWTSNPIIGKWQSETTIPFMGKIVNEIEFTENKEYGRGIVSNVDYEIDGNKIIVTDKSGIGIVYEMIDKDTMRNNMLGMQTIYRRIQ